MERQPQCSRQRTLQREGISLPKFTVGVCRAARPPTITHRGWDTRPAQASSRDKAPRPASHQPQQIFLILRTIKPTS